MENRPQPQEPMRPSRNSTHSDTVPDHVSGNAASAEQRAQRLTALKESRGWTWARMAEELGVSVNTVEAWVYRGALPREQHRRRIAQVFEVSLAYVEYGEEGEPPVNEVAQLAERFRDIELSVAALVDLPAFARSNGERIGALEEIAMRVEEEMRQLRELMEGTATAVKALRTIGVAPPQPEPAESRPREKRATGGRRQSDPPLPPGR